MKRKRNRLREVSAMKLHAVCIGQAEKLPGKSYKTGIFKMPVTGSVLIDAEGIVGDAICNRKHHGGVDQAIYIEGLETLNWWAETLGKPVDPGTFGENLVIAGLDNRDINIGDRFTIGEVVLEATSARIPCATFTARMQDPTFARRYTKAARPGIYCRVISGGAVTPGETVSYDPFEGSKVSVPETMATFGKRLSEETRQRFLAAPIHYKLRRELEAY
ncbi:MOSC domain-containing protein [Agrobacterium rosae]|uniref:MOSC domain-containing protein n=2 Tax=Agrobacterium rosae TaxID=1972867 RepID=A0AAE5S1F4_9HYPH|nr:MOSC domain-containing protein [Agrobacterium rosae]KAA3518133.1 MOSC domain-containing protein [Agrobacterium rosae]MCM2434437.1 MOSC domain-containing protein [Agrobacterium rosae]MQB49719.1 MOSC domain-containing protein [Agrobacterium rosae]POO54026.1 MOSC domain-containing protein [Agrobacterium rosae]